MTEPGFYQVSLTSETCDLGVFMLSECWRFATCYGFADGVAAGTEHFEVELEPGTYTIVVDGFGYHEGCPYSLSVLPWVPPPPPVELWGTDRCDDENLVCLEPGPAEQTVLACLWGNSQDYGIDFGDACIPIYASPTQHIDVVYVLAMNNGDAFEATLNGECFNIYLTDDCESASCLIGCQTAYGTAKPIASCSINYTHSGAYTLLYLIISNTYAYHGDCFTLKYTHTGDCAHPISTETATWGAVKSMYR